MVVIFVREAGLLNATFMWLGPAMVEIFPCRFWADCARRPAR